MKNVIMMTNFSDQEIKLFSDQAKEYGCAVGAHNVLTSIDPLKLPAGGAYVFSAVLINAIGLSDQEIDDILATIEGKNLTCDFFCNGETQKLIEGKIKNSKNVRLRFHKVEKGKIDLTFPEVCESLLPENLKKLCKAATSYIGRNIFSEMSFEFTQAKEPIHKPDLIIYCEVVDKSLFGAVTLRLDSNRFKNASELYQDLDQQVILDTMKEFLNQLLGAVNVNLAQYLRVKPSVSFPVAYQSGNGSGGRLQAVILKPSFSFREKLGAMDFQFQFFSIDPNLNLHILDQMDVSFVSPAEEGELF